MKITYITMAEKFTLIYFSVDFSILITMSKPRYTEMIELIFLSWINFNIVKIICSDAATPTLIFASMT